MHGFDGENLPALVGAYRQEHDNGFIMPLDKSMMSGVFALRRGLFAFAVFIIHNLKNNKNDLR